MFPWHCHKQGNTGYYRMLSLVWCYWQTTKSSEDCNWQLTHVPEVALITWKSILVSLQINLPYHFLSRDCTSYTITIVYTLCICKHTHAPLICCVSVIIADKTDFKK